MASLEIENSVQKGREIIEIEDDSRSDQAEYSDSCSSNEDDPNLMKIEEWIRNTKADQASLQYFDVETRRWMTKNEDLSDDFLMELRDIAGHLDSNDSKIEGDTLVENVLDISRSEDEDRDTGGDRGLGGLEMKIDSVIEDSLAVPASNHQRDFERLGELRADVMHLHGDGAISAVQVGHNMDIDYDFAWTGM